MLRSACVCLAAFFAASVSAKVVTESIEYRHGDVVLEGFLAYDDAAKDRQPGVLVVHEWWGLNDFAKRQATRLAELGYVAFAVDMYGKGKVTDNADQAGKWAGEVRRDEKTWRGRVIAGYEVLANHKRVDNRRIAAIGYCFGGSTCLQLAYSGTNVAGVVSFHGSLMPPGDDDAMIKGRILICHGDADPLVPEEQVRRCEEGLKKAKADYKLIRYASAQHSFTNPNAGKAGIDGVKYDEAADRKSWEDMQEFFKDVLAGKK